MHRLTGCGRAERDVHGPAGSGEMNNDRKVLTRGCRAAIAVFALLAGGTLVAASPTADTDEEARNAARSYVENSVKGFLCGLQPLTEELKKANQSRAAWQPYTVDWKQWTPEEAKAHATSFTYGEYRWSALKDKDFRKSHTESGAAKELKKFQEASGGRIAELFVTDCFGANVAQTQVTSDWFQGDEPKYTEVKGKHDLFVDAPKRDDTVGQVGVQVSIPLWDTTGAEPTFIGVAVATVIVDKI